MSEIRWFFHGGRGSLARHDPEFLARGFQKCDSRGHIVTLGGMRRLVRHVPQVVGRLPDLWRAKQMDLLARRSEFAV